MSSEPLQLMDIVTNLVSRDKLIEWEMFATEIQNKNDDDIFPSVRSYGVVIALIVYLVSLAVPLVSPNDPAACRCMSLLLFVVCLWITEALPYFVSDRICIYIVTLATVFVLNFVLCAIFLGHGATYSSSRDFHGCNEGH